jgi:hypothetical protein
MHTQLQAPRPCRAPSSGRTRTAEVGLHYSDSWAVSLGPNAAAMERRALLWLRERGIIHDQASAEKFARLSVGEYANWPFPMATPKRAETITKFLSLWTFYDDAIEDNGEEQADAIRAAIAGRPARFPGGDAYLRCWWELGQEYGRTMSAAWLDRHAARFSAWVEAVGDEREAMTRLRRTGSYPTATEHLRRRRANIGMTPNLDFLEYQMGWELPAEVLADPLMLTVESCAADAVAIINDVFGFSKDRELRWSNLVSCAMQEREIGPRDAFEWACDLHDARLEKLVACERELLARYPRVRELQDWFVGLHYLIYGFAKWHSRAPRYQARHDIGSEEIRIKIERV